MKAKMEEDPASNDDASKIFSNHQPPCDEIINTAHSETRSMDHDAQLEDLSLRLLRAQEHERSRLAYELHDEIGQDLTILKLNLQAGLKALEKLTDHLPELDDFSKLETKLTNSYDLSNQLLEASPQLIFEFTPHHVG